MMLLILAYVTVLITVTVHTHLIVVESQPGQTSSGSILTDEDFSIGNSKRFYGIRTALFLVLDYLTPKSRVENKNLR